MIAIEPERTVTVRIGNQLAELARVSQAVDTFGVDNALPQPVLNAMNIALDEVLNNTISYSYLDDERHELVVTLSMTSGALEAEVQDDGVAFNPLEVAPPVLSDRLQDRRVGGLGLHFVRSLMDDVQYRRDGGANYLRLIKRLA